MACANGSCAVRNLTRHEKRAEYTHSVENAFKTYQGLRDDLLRIGCQYFECSVGVEGIEEDLHDIWDELIHASMVLPAVSAEHDRLVMLVVSMRELGTFARYKKGSDVHERAEEDSMETTDERSSARRESAVMANGQKLWTDLPYLATDLYTFWTQESQRLSTTERESLATFTAKLCAVGACDDDLANCAMWLLKQTFEVERLLTQVAADKQADTLSVAEMLPACVAWMNHCNFRLLRLCEQGVSVSTIPETEPETDTPARVQGDQASIEGDEGRSGVSVSFSLSRWLLWRAKMGKFHGSGIRDISKVAREGFEAMISTGLAVGVDVPGEKTYLDRLFEVLDAEMAARGGVGCVEASDVEIDAEWAL